MINLLAYFRCPVCKEQSNGRKCIYCKRGK